MQPLWQDHKLGELVHILDYHRVAFQAQKVASFDGADDDDDGGDKWWVVGVVLAEGMAVVALQLVPAAAAGPVLHPWQVVVHYESLEVTIGKI